MITVISWFSRWGLGSINRQGQPFVFYLHPWEVDPGQPRLDVKWFSRFRHYNNLDVCEERLSKLLGHFRFTTMGNVLRAQGLLGAERMEAGALKAAGGIA